MSRGILLEPSGIDRAASQAAARALAIDEVAGSITSVSLAGLEPRTVGRTMDTLQRATTLAQRASGITGAQGPALRQRAALARAADAGGGGVSIKPWDPLLWANRLRNESLVAYKKLLDDEGRALSQLFGARDVHGGRNPRALLYRRKYRAWEDMRRQFWNERSLRAQRVKTARRFVERFDFNAKAIARAKAEWAKIKEPKPGSLFSRLGEKIGKVAKFAGRAVGPAMAVTTAIYNNESADLILQRLGAAVLAEGAAVLIQVAGGVACAAVTVGSGGPGALACPAIVGATAAVAAIATAEIANHQIDKRKEGQKQKAVPPKPPARRSTPGICVPVVRSATAR